MKRKIKHFFQWITRGFDDSETWSLDYSLARLILPRLKRFREIGATQITPLPFESHEEWLSTLDDMIYAFEFYASLFNKAQPDYDMDRVDKGLVSFALYYHNLWW